MNTLNTTRRTNLWAVACSTLLVAANALAAGEVTVAANHITLFGKKYFRGNSPSVTLGAYGEKKTPVFGQNYLEVQDTMPAPKIDAAPVDKATTVEIDYSKSSKGDIEAFVKGILPVDGAGEVTYDKLKTAQLKLVYLVIHVGDLKTQVNSAGKVLDNLRSYGNDARVCHEILVAMKAETADTFASAGSIQVTKAGTGLSLTASGKKSATVTVSSGTTFAYLLAKADWENNKDKIKKFTDDQWSVN